MALRVTREYADVLGAGDGKVRVTRQYVEVLTSGYPKARVSRQYVEVLASLPDDTIRVTRQSVAILADPPEAAEIFVIVNDTLAFAPDQADRLWVGNVIAHDDTLAFTETAYRVYECIASDGLIIGDEVEVEIVQGCADTLTISDEAVYGMLKALKANDTLVFDDDVADRLGSVRGRQAIDDGLTLQDAGTKNGSIFGRGAVDSWPKSQWNEIAGYERIKPLYDVLAISDQADVSVIRQARDDLYLSDEANQNRIGTRHGVDDSLTFTEATRRGHVSPRVAEDTIAFSELADGYIGRDAYDTLEIGDESDGWLVRLALDDDLSFTEEADIGSGSVYNRSALDRLTGLTDQVHHDWERYAYSSDTLSLSEEARLLNWAVDDGLSFTEQALAVSAKPSTDRLYLSDSATVVRSRTGGFDTLVLGETVGLSCIKNRIAYDRVQMTEFAWPGLHHATAIDYLQRTYISYDPETYEPIIEYEGLQESATKYLVDAAPRELGDRLRVRETAACVKIRVDAIAAEASDNLTLFDWINPCQSHSMEDNIRLTDAAEVLHSKPINDTLGLSDSARLNINRNSLSANDTVEVGEVVFFYNALEDYLYVYHPFVGGGSGDLPTPPPGQLEGPIVGVVDDFKLVWPVAGPFSDTLALRAPNLGNRDRLQMNRISRETRGGTLVVYADPMWPKIQTLVLNFSGLSWDEANGLHVFMDEHLGLEIGLLDWEHRFWGGVITKLDDPIVQDGRGCQYSVGFEFEGELATYSP